MYKYVNLWALLHLFVFSKQMDFKMDYEDKYNLKLTDLFL
jgi:hypothetical protein